MTGSKLVPEYSVEFVERQQRQQSGATVEVLLNDVTVIERRKEESKVDAQKLYEVKQFRLLIMSAST